MTRVMNYSFPPFLSVADQKVASYRNGTVTFQRSMTQSSGFCIQVCVVPDQFDVFGIRRAERVSLRMT